MKFLKTFIEELISFTKLFAISIIIIIPIKYFLIEPFLVQGESMLPNYKTGNYLIINKLKNITSDIERGDILVFVPPKERNDSLLKYSVYFDPRIKYIKRVIGLPGETVKLENRKIHIKKVGENNFTTLIEPYITYKGIHREKEIELSHDEYFMVGDNRSNSSDSRSWGPIKKSDIIGEPVLRLFPISKIDIYPAHYNF